MNTNLFPLTAQHSHKRFLGVKDIPVEQIVSTSSRRKPSDRMLRPLQRYLPDPQIVLYKVGEQYFVESGHYRVSIARFLEKRSVRARIWELPILKGRSQTQQAGQTAERSCAKRYAR